VGSKERRKEEQKKERKNRTACNKEASLALFVSCPAHVGEWDKSWMDVGTQRPERVITVGGMHHQPFIAKLVHKRLQSTATLVQRFSTPYKYHTVDRRGGRYGVAVDECFVFVGGTYGGRNVQRLDKRWRCTW
jgi:hypothetical protein